MKKHLGDRKKARRAELSTKMKDKKLKMTKAVRNDFTKIEEYYTTENPNLEDVLDFISNKQ